MTLVRNYNQSLNEKAVLHKMINQAENYAAHKEQLDAGLEDSVLAMLSDMNDNDWNSFGADMRRRREVFAVNVAKKHKRIKNRLREKEPEKPRPKTVKEYLATLPKKYRRIGARKAGMRS
jgi:hypothetical protein